MNADGDVAVVRRVLELIGALDVDAALGFVTDGLILEFPFRGDGGPRTLHGDDAKHFIAAMPKLFSQLPLVDVVVHGQLPSGQVVAEYRSEGVTRAGRSYPNSYVGFFGLRDGRIHFWREYFDPNVIAAAFPVA